MGYISIQINKAKGSADTGASDHIERKTTPKNADPTRTAIPRRCGRPHRGDKPPHPHGWHQAEDNTRPSTGNPHRAFGHARGHGEGAGRGQAGRMVR